MRLLFSLIGYLAVATLLSASLGLGYLWQSQRLTDEKVFRIVAMVHGVDIDGENSEEDIDETFESETPPKEPSLVEEERLREIALRNVEVRLNALERGQREFDHIFRQLTEARERIDSIASELEERIEAEAEIAERESITDVVNNLKSLKAEAAKDQLLKIYNAGGSDPDAKQVAMDDTIKLIKALPSNTRTGILKKFATEEEKQQLHEILQQMLDGGSKSRDLEEVMRQLKSRDFSS